MIVPFTTKTIVEDNTALIEKTPKRFFKENPELEKFLTFVKTYRNKHGVMPTKERLLQENLDGFYNTSHPSLSNPITDLYEQFFETLKENSLNLLRLECEEGEQFDYDKYAKETREIANLSPDKKEAYTVYDDFDEHFVIDMSNTDYISSGFPNLDLYSGGLAPSDYLLLAAPTGGGKSTFATAQAVRGLYSGLNTLYINKEERVVDVKRRIYAQLGGFNNLIFRVNTPANFKQRKAHKPMVQKELSKLKKLGGGVFYPKKPVKSIREVQDIYRDYKELGVNFDQVIIENLYLYGTDTIKSDVDWREIRALSIQLRDFALENEVRVWATTQLKGDRLSYATQIKDDVTMLLSMTTDEEQSTKMRKVHAVTVDKNRYGNSGAMSDVMFLEVDFNNFTCKVQGDSTGDNIFKKPL